MYLQFEFSSGTYAQFQALLAANFFEGDVYGITLPPGNALIYAVDPHRKYIYKYAVQASGASAPLPSSFTADFPNAELVGTSSLPCNLSIANQF